MVAPLVAPRTARAGKGPWRRWSRRWSRPGPRAREKGRGADGRAAGRAQDRARGKRSSHDQGMPMARKCHGDFHANSGVFKGWKREQLREWQTEQVARWQALWNLRGSPCDFG